MNALTIAGSSLRRLFRDRIALFFVILLPIIVILLIGATMGTQGGFRLGVVAGPGPLADGLAPGLNSSRSLETESFGGEEAALDALRRGEIDAILVVPSTSDADLDSGTIEIPLLTTGSSSTGQGVWSSVTSVVARQASAVQAARFAAAEAGGTPSSRRTLADSLEPVIPKVAVRAETVDSANDTLPPGFGYSAPTILVLFVFINSLAGGASIIESRRLGIHTRALAAPIRSRDIVAGEALSCLGLSAIQSGLIITMGTVLFGVSWGDPVAAVVLTGIWALVGTGGGMLCGTLFRTAEQASAIGPAIGVAFGMLGGCMWPLEIVPETIRTLGHATPHAWAIDAWTILLSGDRTVTDILVPLAVLVGFAVLLISTASLRLHRTLLR